MDATWNLTSTLVADRRIARESSASRHRLLAEARRGHRLFNRRPVSLVAPMAPVERERQSTPTTAAA